MAEYPSPELKNIGKFVLSGDSSSGILIFFSPRANRLLNDVFAQFSAVSHLGTNKLKPRTQVAPVTDEQCAAVSEWLQLMEHQHQRSFSFSTSLGPLTMIQRRLQSDRRLAAQDAQTIIQLLHTITGASVGDEVNWLLVVGSPSP